MAAFLPLLALLFLGARAQHDSQWTYSGKPAPRGLCASSLPSPLLGLPFKATEGTLNPEPPIRTRGIRSPFPDPHVVCRCFALEPFPATALVGEPSDCKALCSLRLCMWKMKL